jgi:hypothetical protein
MPKEPITLTDEARARLWGTARSLKEAQRQAVNDKDHPLNRKAPMPATPVTSKDAAIARMKAAQAARDKASEAAKPKPPTNPWHHATGDKRADLLFAQKAQEHEQQLAQAAAAEAEDQARRASPQFAEALQAAERRVGLAKGTPMELKSLEDLENLKVSADVEQFTAESQKTLDALNAANAEARKAINASITGGHLESKSLSDRERKLAAEQPPQAPPVTLPASS